MKMTRYVILLMIFFINLFCNQLMAQPMDDELRPSLQVNKTDDFSISGNGVSANWQKAEWFHLIQRSNQDQDGGKQTRAKVLYSDKGLYVLFENEDRLITTPYKSDFEELWKGDVVEIFLWTDTLRPHYFEYEVTPLNYELPLIVSNIEGELFSWIPFENTYQDDRKVKHKTVVTGGEKKNGEEISSWSAEIFIPFELLYPLENIHPKSGITWRANLYRIDYDDGGDYWSWSPFEGNFHDYKNFGTFRFE